MWLLLMLGLCGVGVRIALTNTEPYSPDATPTVAQSISNDVIFILDAGHGESTETEPYMTKAPQTGSFGLST